MAQTAMQVTGGSQSVPSTATQYIPISGTDDQLVTTEAEVQVQVQTALTAKNLLIRISSNGRNGTSTFVSRKNAGNGSLSISIAGGQTGTLEDVADSDSLASSDLYNYAFTLGGTAGSTTFGLCSCTLDQSTAMTSYLVINGTGLSLSSASSNFNSINGRLQTSTNENSVKFTFRYDTVLGPSGVYVSANAATKAVNVRVRQNGANSAIDISIASTATGLFTSSTTIAVSSGNTIDWDIVIANGNAGAIVFELLFMQNQPTSVNSWTTESAYAGAGAINSGLNNQFIPLSNDLSVQTTEAFYQLKTRGVVLTAQNFLVQDISNSLNGSTVISLRDGGSSTAVSVTISSGATGVFEDTVDSASISVGDLINNLVDTSGASSGTITLHQIGSSYTAPAAQMVYAMPSMTTVTLVQYTSATPYA